MRAAETASSERTGAIPDDLAGLNLIELLQQLQPVPEPDPVSLWPQTPLWSWLALALVALAAWSALARWRRWQANAYRRAALAEVRHAADDPAKLAEILRRTALCAYPRSAVASLYGEEWRQFLNQHCDSADFDSDTGRALASAAYSPAARSARARDLAALASQWIRGHRTAAGDQAR